MSKQRRNIPTRVGKSTRPTGHQPERPEHPHSRGEKSHDNDRITTPNGTSPLAWGKAVAAKTNLIVDRNIPTRVGKRKEQVFPFRKSTEHPHSRGEKCAQGKAFVNKSGTSPLAWGKEGHSEVDDLHVRNIPTRVGKRAGMAIKRLRIPEHPHSRGEKDLFGWGQAGHDGTSPLAWGKVWRCVGNTVERRNIPTRVGKSRRCRLMHIMSTEHPHSRGEKHAKNRKRLPSNGTSPLAWGKGSSTRCGGRWSRNIPTRVGKSTFLNHDIAETSEHPHSRGEKTTHIAKNSSSVGTSPLAWGKDLQVICKLINKRNIPTRVGKRRRCGRTG